MTQTVNAITCILFIICGGDYSPRSGHALELSVSDWKLPALVSSLVLFQFTTSIVSIPPMVTLTAASLATASEFEPLWYRLKILMRILNIIHDALILFLTWYRTRGMLRDLARKAEDDDSVSTRLLLNGAIYFMLVHIAIALRISDAFTVVHSVHLFLNVADAVLTVTKVGLGCIHTIPRITASRNTQVFDDTSIFNGIFTPLILSHFFLSIRRAQHQATTISV
ncbi:uncharacterized protein B0H18DRAFT_1116886 [Fomitopsis serialis]|uniref:uncharacterized protein n=1 Tax=Fomitopsis serialis TaxID=139415 RepID=UPI00200875A4|nr:uncharacterized protein B0H18DRAFT_1116886 [Neoantrodia serialis]KAH9930775.1 hypothetical protein B0H18DRAFT_1116886 [Neoantrodia serialis]